MNDDISETLEAPPDRQRELLETNAMHTLGDLVDAHGESAYDLDVTTDGLDTADLQGDDPLKTVVGFAGNFSNDGMAGERVDDALSTNYDEPEATMAGEYGPDDADLGSDMSDNLMDAEDESETMDTRAVLSGGVGLVDEGGSAPTGFQIETLSAPGEAPGLFNERGEPDFAVTDEATGARTAASAVGFFGSEDNDDVHSRDLTDGT
jgi:hypothetical protein